ncbi:MAG TPA: tetratricopeptide repeat protein, partial [Cytophagales bacterium]
MKQFLCAAGMIWVTWVHGVPAHGVPPGDRPAAPAAARADTATVTRYLRLARSYEQSHPDSATLYYRRADLLSGQLNHPAGRIRALLEAARLMRTQDKPDSMVALGNRAAGYARQHRLEQWLGMAYVSLGTAYLVKSDYQQAISYALQGKALHEQRGDTLHAAEADRVLSAVYIGLRQYDKAIAHARQVLRVARQCGDRPLALAALNNQGVALLKQGRFAAARRLFEEAYPLAQRLGNDHLLRCLANLGQAHLNLHQVDQGLGYYRRALALGQRLHNQEGIAAACFGIGLGHFMRKEYAEARQYLARARQIGEAHH